jgi:hypothetical protein
MSNSDVFTTAPLVRRPRHTVPPRPAMCGIPVLSGRGVKLGDVSGHGTEPSEWCGKCTAIHGRSMQQLWDVFKMLYKTFKLWVPCVERVSLGADRGLLCCRLRKHDYPHKGPKSHADCFIIAHASMTVATGVMIVDDDATAAAVAAGAGPGDRRVVTAHMQTWPWTETASCAMRGEYCGLTYIGGFRSKLRLPSSWLKRNCTCFKAEDAGGKCLSDTTASRRGQLTTCSSFSMPGIVRKYKTLRRIQARLFCP